ncbi:MAG: hypothetical protein R3D85_15015 [Paracoccaceae bacterium]
MPAFTFRPALVAALILAAQGAAALDSFTDGANVSDTDLASADLYVSDVSVLDGNVCIGNGCADTETFAAETLLKLRASVTSIEFDDNSGASFPRRDWRIQINDDLATTSGGLEHFSIRDLSAGTVPFTIEGGQPNATLYLGNDGRVGVGTTLPQARLHLVSGWTPSLRFEQDTSLGYPAQTWQIRPNDLYFDLNNVTASTYPFRVKSDAETNLLTLAGSHVGIGGVWAANPQATLHLVRNDGSAQLKVQETSLTTSPRSLLYLENNGRPEIVMANIDTGGEWSFGAGTNFVLKQGVVGTTSNAKTKLFEIDPAGNATLTGSLVTGGTACGGGCDRVFTERAIIPEADYATAMWQQGFLPHVGATPEGAPLNVSEKLGGMLNALEHAHVFIDRQR